MSSMVFSSGYLRKNHLDEKEPVLCGYIVFIYLEIRVYINFSIYLSNG
jgi:hypothetical protein